MKKFLAAMVLAILAAAGMQAAAPKGDQASPAVVDVYYFHGNQRCMSCNRIEAYTKEAVEKRFAKDVKNGRVLFHAVNLQTPGNEHYIQDFKINAKTVVITRSVGGKAESFRTLDKVWVLLRDKKKFQEYVEKNVDAAKKGA